MLLDPMGYHTQAERYLAVFKKHQGSTVPPGKAFRPHPGYLGTPKVYQATNWLSDNGALLWAFSEHALLSRDEKFIAAYTPAILKSCEWIRDARRRPATAASRASCPRIRRPTKGSRCSPSGTTAGTTRG